MRTIPLLVTALLVVGCTSSGPDSSTPASVSTSLCNAVSATEADAARSAFGEGHDALHTLGRDLEDAELRAEAARLLEAKQLVESAVAEDLPINELGPRLVELQTATDRALMALDRPTADCD